jgi:hypothetical protein
MEAQKERSKLYAPRYEARRRVTKRRRDKSTRGRECKWPHCRVDDKDHIVNWNSPLDACPSCYRQILRLGPCKRCGGPRYHQRKLSTPYCPTCEPLVAKPGEVSVTLVCLATGKEHLLVRKISWRLPNGVPLSRVQDEGFAVIDVSPKVWAGIRV